jgi:hypothetical protein
VDVIPSTGTTVGGCVAGGGNGVSDGRGVEKGGKVAVTIWKIGVTALFSLICIPHPVQNKARRMAKDIFNTSRFYRVPQKSVSLKF